MARDGLVRDGAFGACWPSAGGFPGSFYTSAVPTEYYYSVNYNLSSKLYLLLIVIRGRYIIITIILLLILLLPYYYPSVERIYTRGPYYSLR